jgi:effector-binding domain-containing protein
MTVQHPENEAAASGARQPAEPELRRLAMRETAVVKVDVPVEELPGAIGGAVAEVEASMAEAGVGLAGPPFARYLAFGPAVRAEIGFPVERPAPHVGRVYPGTLPGGRVASVVHVGPYDGLARTYEALQRWLEGRGLHPSGPMWEVYWSDPETEPDPATWRTEIFAPVG